LDEASVEVIIVFVTTGGGVLCGGDVGYSRTQWRKLHDEEEPCEITS